MLAINIFSIQFISYVYIHIYRLLLLYPSAYMLGLDLKDKIMNLKQSFFCTADSAHKLYLPYKKEMLSGNTKFFRKEKKIKASF